MLDFVKADHATLFILAKSKYEYSKIIQSRRTQDDSLGSSDSGQRRRSSAVVLLQVTDTSIPLTIMLDHIMY